MKHMLPQEYSTSPSTIVRGKNRNIHDFSTGNGNIDQSVVASFGEEWSKFHDFDEVDINRISSEYFDILNDRIINANTYAIDIGCGSGRWTKCLLPKVGFMEAVDPSDALYAADHLLGDAKNVRLTRASTDTLPFPDNTFDFAMSIGVLHHIPDTQKAMDDCVKKVKVGGYFYTYLYYSLDNRGLFYRTLLKGVTVIRKGVSSLPSRPKKFACDLLAVGLYMPFVLVGRALSAVGLKKLAHKVPLSTYQDKSFYIIRNDSLDRFGTSLEQRFSKTEIIDMMVRSGLTDIVVSDKMPYWHAVGQKK